MIKKIFILILVLVLLAIAALAIFLLTFDADRYRPEVVKQIESALGKPVELGRLSLTWSKGIALKMSQLAIYEDASKQNPVIQLDEVSAVVRLLPLLRKQVEIGSIQLERPYLHLIRSADGTVGVAGIEPRPQAAPGAQAPPPGPGEALPPAAKEAAPLPPFLVDLVEISEGKIRFSDGARRPPLDLTVQELDLTVKNASFTRPIGIQGRLAAFSPEQNIQLKGRLRLNPEEGVTLLEEASLKTDLGRLEISDLVKTFPELGELKIQERLKGDLVLQVETLRVDSSGLRELLGEARLEGGRVVLADLGSPLEEITAKVQFQKESLRLENLSAHLAGGTLSASGKADHLTTRPLSAFEFNAQGLVLERLARIRRPDEPHMKGKLAATFQGTAQGIDGNEISLTLSGQGRVNVTEGVLANVNVIREVFGKLSVIPRLGERLQERLPESYQAKLAANDTVFEPIDVPFLVKNGVVFVDRLQIVSESFGITGMARIGLDGRVASQAVLIVDPDLSAAFIHSINELQYLADAQGRLQIPLVISGRFPEIRVLPDVQHVASLLAAAKTREVVSGFLQKQLQQKTGPGPAPTEPATSQEPRPSLFGELLETALQGTTEPGETAQ